MTNQSKMIIIPSDAMLRDKIDKCRHLCYLTEGEFLRLLIDCYNDFITGKLEIRNTIYYWIYLCEDIKCKWRCTLDYNQVNTLYNEMVDSVTLLKNNDVFSEGVWPDLDPSEIYDIYLGKSDLRIVVG